MKLHIILGVFFFTSHINASGILEEAKKLDISPECTSQLNMLVDYLKPNGLDLSYLNPNSGKRKISHFFNLTKYVDGAGAINISLIDKGDKGCRWTYTKTIVFNDKTCKQIVKESKKLSNSVRTMIETGDYTALYNSDTATYLLFSKLGQNSCMVLETSSR